MLEPLDTGAREVGFTETPYDAFGGALAIEDHVFVGTLGLPNSTLTEFKRGMVVLQNINVTSPIITDNMDILGIKQLGCDGEILTGETNSPNPAIDNQGRIIRLDNQGNLVWDFIDAGPSPNLGSAIVEVDVDATQVYGVGRERTALVGGDFVTSSILWILSRATGALISRTSLGSQAARNVRIGIDGNIVIVHGRFSAPPPSGDFIEKRTPANALVWSFPLARESIGLDQDTAGAIYHTITLAGVANVFKRNAAGTVLWSSVYDPIVALLIPRDLAVAQNGNVIVTSAGSTADPIVELRASDGIELTSVTGTPVIRRIRGDRCGLIWTLDASDNRIRSYAQGTLTLVATSVGLAVIRGLDTARVIA